MTLLKQWDNLIQNQTDDTFNAFWERYSSAEKRIYAGILGDKNPHVTGVLKDLAEKYETDTVIFTGFIDGINTSLTEPIDLKSLTEESLLELNIDWEKLFFNMLKAEADYLFTLDEWDGLLTEERRQEIYKDFRRSRTVVKEKEPGRNDPCPCGSGKKYKKCCGRNE